MRSVSFQGVTTLTAVTKSDMTTYTPLLDALYVGTTGDINVVDALGNTVLFTSVPAGSILPIRCLQVLSTNTTASNIIGMIYELTVGTPSPPVSGQAGSPIGLLLALTKDS